jgi:hypothetical protein
MIWNPKAHVCFIATTFMAMMTTVSLDTKGAQGYVRPATHSTSVQTKLELFLKDRYIAEAISKTKRPYIIAAIKYEESRRGGPYTVGDEGDSRGMYQVQPKHHGPVPDGVEPQTNQCERILEPLINRYGVEEGIRRYNGRGPSAEQYARRVLRTAIQLKRS